MENSSSDKSQGHPRSTKIDAEVLDTRKKLLEFDDATLSAASGVSVRTIERARAGEPISIENATLLRIALQVDMNTLINGYEPAIPKPPTKRQAYEMKICLAKSRKEMQKPGELERHVALLRSLIGATASIDVTKMEDGSTILTLCITNADTLRLLAAMLDGNLSHLDITKITIDDHSWITQMLMCIKLFFTPGLPEAEAWNEMQCADYFARKLHIRTARCVLCEYKSS